MSRAIVSEGRRALEVLVCFDGAVLGAHQLVDGESLAVGGGTPYPVEALGERALEVAGIDAGGAFVRFLDGGEGDVTVGEARRSFAELAREGRCPLDEPGVRRSAIAPGATVLVDFGAVSVVVRETAAAPRLPPSLRIDWRAHRITAAVFLGAALFLGLAFSVPPDPAMASGDLLRLDNRTVSARFSPSLLEHQKRAFEARPTATRAPSGASPAPEPSGRAGDRKARTHGHLALPGTAKEVRIAGGTDLRAMAQSSGILQVLGADRSGRLGVVLDPSRTAFGDAAEVFNGNLDGLQAGPGWGNGGGGIVGDGPGGGCTGPDCAGTVALGELCPGGHCGGSPDGRPHGRGAPLVTMRRGPAQVVEIPRGEVKVIGGPDKDTIRRVIRAHMNEVRFCYERELAADATLDGRVVVSFLINRDGRVASSVPKESTLRTPAVGRCVAEAVARMSFPMPPNAGLASVSYPFVFHRAGAQ